MAVSAQYASVTNEAACSIDPLSFHNFRIIWYGKDYKQFCKGHPEVQLWIVTFFGSVVIQLWAPCICLHPPFFLHPFNFDHPSLLSSLAPPSLPPSLFHPPDASPAKFQRSVQVKRGQDDRETTGWYLHWWESEDEALSAHATLWKAKWLYFSI